MPCMTRRDFVLNVFCKDPVPSLDEDGPLGQCSILGHISCLVSSWAIRAVSRDKDLQEIIRFENKTNKQDFCREVTSDDYRHHDLGPEDSWRVRTSSTWPSLSTPCLLDDDYFICLIMPVFRTFHHHANNHSGSMISKWVVCALHWSKNKGSCQ